MRERWFGATGRSVPEIALAGDLDVQGALVLDGVDDARDARRACGGPSGRGARSHRRRGEGCARPPGSRFGLVDDPALLDLDLTELTYGDPVVATFSIAACDLEAAQWGVATQSKFLAVGSVVPGPSRTSARSRRRRTRTHGTALRAWRSCGRGSRRGVGRAAHVCRRRPRSPPGRNRRRRRTQRDLYRRELHEVGGRDRRHVLRSAGKHPRRR